MVFTEFHEGGTPLLRRLMSEQMFSFPMMAFTPLGGFAETAGSSTQLHGLGKNLLLKMGRAFGASARAFGEVLAERSSGFVTAGFDRD